MNKPMRRKDRALNSAECLELLNRAEYGVLSTVDQDGQPYGVPLSFVHYDDRIYFHCAREGYKVDNLRHEPRACFTVVGETKPVYDKNFTTYFESVIAAGIVKPIEDDEEKYRSLYALAKKYLPDHLDKAPDDIAHSLKRTAVYALEIQSLTGKAKKPKPE